MLILFSNFYDNWDYVKFSVIAVTIANTVLEIDPILNLIMETGVQ